MQYWMRPAGQNRECAENQLPAQKGRMRAGDACANLMTPALDHCWDWAPICPLLAERALATSKPSVLAIYLPGLEQRPHAHVGACLPCAQRCELHALRRCGIPYVVPAPVFDSLPAFGKGALNVAGMGFQTKVLFHSACDRPMAVAFEPVGKVSSR